MEIKAPWDSNFKVFNVFKLKNKILSRSGT